MSSRTSTRQQIQSKSKLEQFLTIANYRPGSPTSYILLETLDSNLIFNNGGPWCRFDGLFGKRFQAIKVRANLKLEYSWDVTEEEKTKYEKEVNTKCIKSIQKGNPIKYIKIVGEKESPPISRSIRKDIRKHFKNCSCVVCGKQSSIEIDHKNGLYNDPRVLNIETQEINDFQPLCKHCNDQKRQTYIWQLQHQKRYPATLIPMLKNWNIDFISGSDSYDSSDPNAMRGTFWYDPVVFLHHLQTNLI